MFQFVAKLAIPFPITADISLHGTIFQYPHFINTFIGRPFNSFTSNFSRNNSHFISEKYAVSAKNLQHNVTMAGKFFRKLLLTQIFTLQESFKIIFIHWYKSIWCRLHTQKKSHILLSWGLRIEVLERLGFSI